MSSIPPLTRDIGQAERGMRALLEQKLDEAYLSFSEWTVLVILDGSEPLTRADLVKRLLGGHVVTDAGTAQATLDGLLSAGLLSIAEEKKTGNVPRGNDDNIRLVLSAAAEGAYRPVRQAVTRVTDSLYGNLPQSDLEATHRTLVEISRRANTLLTDTNRV